MHSDSGLVNGHVEGPSTEAQAAQQLLGQPFSLGYQRDPVTSVFWYADGTLLPYWRMVYDIPGMLSHPRVLFPYGWYKAGIANVRFTITKASSSQVGEFANAELTNFWERSLGSAQQVYDYGWLGAEAMYHEVKGLVRFHSMHAFLPLDVWAVTRGKQYRGFNLANVHGREAAGKVFLWGAHRWPAKGLWFSHNRMYDRFYGRSQLYGAWRPWRRLGTRDAGEEVTDLAFVRAAIGPFVMWYPPTAFQKKTGTGADYDASREKSREWSETVKAGPGMALPNIRDAQGNKLWEFEWPDHVLDVSPLLGYCDKLEKDICAGLGIPPEVLEASETGSGYSGRMIPMIGYYASQMHNVRNIANAFATQSLTPLVRWMFGPEASFEFKVELVVPEELTGVTQQQPQPGAAVPGGGPQQLPGQGGATPEQPAQPTAATPEAGAGPQTQPAQEPGVAPGAMDGTPVTGPRGGHWVRNLRSGKLRHAELGTVLEDGEVAYELAAVHAPSGYTRQKPLVIAGRAFVGGEFIPGQYLAQATPQQRQSLGLLQPGQKTAYPNQPDEPLPHTQAAVRGVEEQDETLHLPEALLLLLGAAEVEERPEVQGAERRYPPADPNGTDTFERHRGADGNWTPQRRLLHEEIDAKLRAHVPATGERIYTTLGGGPASGKSSIIHAGLASLPAHHVAIDSDAIKGELPEYHPLVKVGDKRAAGYVHEESSYLSKVVQDRAFKAGQNVVLDGTGDNSLESVKKRTDQARAAGFKVHAEYVTCSTDEAVRRAEARAAETGRAVPLDMLRRVHKGVSGVLPAALAAGCFDQCRLWDSEHQTDGKPTLVMSAEGTEATIHNPELWQKFLDKANEDPSVPAQPKAAGPSEQEYLSQAMGNLKKTSRTASGVVDTSASAGKAAKMAEGLTGAQAAEHAARNFEAAIRGVYKAKDRPPRTPEAVTHLADTVNRQVNQGITKEGVLLRDDDSSKFPYTRVAELPLARRQFAEEFARRLSDANADPVETAAWVEWRANLTDHFWADGVGKTSKALAMIPLMRAGLPLPQYRDNKEFFAAAGDMRKPYDPKQGGASYLDGNWRRFLAYYRTLMPTQAGGKAA